MRGRLARLDSSWRRRLTIKFGTRPVALWNGLFAFNELVVVSDVAPCIPTSCEKIFVGRKLGVIMDQFLAVQYADADAGWEQTEGLGGDDKGPTERTADR